MKGGLEFKTLRSKRTTFWRDLLVKIKTSEKDRGVCLAVRQIQGFQFENQRI